MLKSAYNNPLKVCKATQALLHSDFYMLDVRSHLTNINTLIAALSKIQSIQLEEG